MLFCSCVFSPLSIGITLLGKERANFSAFRTFVWFALVWFCLFPLPIGVWEGLRLVIMALPGLFSYIFMPPTSKLKGHIASGVFVRSSRFLMHSIILEPRMLLFWNFLYGFLMRNSWHIFFFSWQDYSLSQSYGPLKKYRCILVSKISQKQLKLEPWNFMKRLIVISRWPD